MPFYCSFLRFFISGPSNTGKSLFLRLFTAPIQHALINLSSRNFYLQNVYFTTGEYINTSMKRTFPCQLVHICTHWYPGYTINSILLIITPPPSPFHHNDVTVDVAYCDEMEPHHLKSADLKLMCEGVNGGINVKHGEMRSVAHDVPVRKLYCTSLVVFYFIASNS